MAKYVLTNKAVEDLSKIWEYTYNTWPESQADKYYELLIDTCLEISENPGIGKKYEDIATEILGLRVGRHIIFYRCTQSNGIEVLRILHGSMDLRNKINE